MNTFQNLSLNRKLSVALCSFCAGMLVIVGVCLFNLGELKRNIDFVGRTMAKRVEQLNEARDYQRQLIINERDILLSKDSKEHATLLKRRQELWANANSNLETYLKDSLEEGREIMDKYRQLLDKYREVSGKVIDLHVRQGRFADALTLVDSEERGIRGEALKYQDTLADLAEKRMALSADEAEVAYGKTRMQLLIVSSISILFGASLAVLILRALSRSMNQVIAELEGAAVQVTSASRQVASSSQELSSSTTEQAASIEQTASAVDEMT